MSLGRPRPRAGLVLAPLLAFLVFVPTSAAATPFKRDSTPLPADVTGTTAKGAHVAVSHGSSTSGAAVHMLLGLAVVLALIYVLYRILKRSSNKNEKTVRGDGWMSVISSTPLAQSRSIHLVRVGEEIVLVGSSETGVTPIRVYSADEARRLRIEPDEMFALGGGLTGRSDQSFLTSMVESLKRMTAR